MRFTCAWCAKTYRLPEKRLGGSGVARVRCPNCRAVVSVQRDGDAEALAVTLVTEGEAAKAASGAVAPAPVAAPAAQGGPAAPAGTEQRRKQLGLWHVAINKESKGPFSVPQLAELVRSGQIKDRQLVWQKGREGWAKLNTVEPLWAAVSAELAPDGDDDRTQAMDVVSAAAAASSDAKAPAADAAKAAEQKKATEQKKSADAAKAAEQKKAADAAKAAEQRKAAEQKKAADAAKAAEQKKSTDAAKAAEQQKATRKGKAAKASAKGSAKANPPAGARDKAKKAGGKSSGGFFGGGAAEAPRADAQQGAAGGTDDFFAGGLDDVELELPDPNKHKPTKEEYQNLLQEFSVMFRLDKRGKRQKVAIGVALAALVVGVVAFGVMLKISGDKKRALLQDARTILAVFSLPYQSSVSINMHTGEDGKEDPAGKSARTDASELSSRLLSVTRKKKTQWARKKVDRPSGGGGGGGARAPSRASTADVTKLSAADLAKIKAAQAGAFAGGGSAGRVKGPKINLDVSASQLKGVCRSKSADMRGCSEAHAGGAPGRASMVLGTNGRITSVRATVGGSPNGALSACIKGKLGGVNFGSQSSEKSFSCPFQ